MAASGRPEVASDVIFGGNVEVIEVDLLCKFYESSSNRFRDSIASFRDTHTDAYTRETA